MARPTSTEDAKTLLAALRKLRERVGNGFMRTHLGWGEDRYWRAHELLLEKGKIVKGRGRGGSIGTA